MTNSLYDHINNISYGKKNIDLIDKKGYNQFLINKFLSNGIDTIFYANIMNQCANIDDNTHYDCLLKVVPKRRRWYNNKKNDSLSVCDKKKVEMLKEYYGYSDNKAKAVLHLVNNWEEIERKLNKGGRQ